MKSLEEHNFLLLSIQQKFIDLIREGKKTWEYRKVIPQNTISGILFYCPEENDFCSIHTPVKKIVGSPLEIATHYVDRPELKESLLRYYGQRKNVVAFKLLENRFLRPGTKKILEEKSLQKFRAPQGFQYINSNHPLNTILELGL